jgi:hypothetical protein
MDLKYCDTIYVARNFLTKKQCKIFIKEYEENKQFSLYETSTSYITNSTERSNCSVFPINPETNSFNLIHNLSKKFINEWVEYLDTFKSFFVRVLKENLKYSHSYRIIKYEKGGYIHPHIDWDHFIHASMTFNLNDEYEGGEFVFFNGKYSIKLGTGDAIIFPADPFWVHEIRPIISGTRYSINTFICSLPHQTRKEISKYSKILSKSKDIIDPWHYGIDSESKLNNLDYLNGIKYS